MEKENYRTLKKLIDDYFERVMEKISKVEERVTGEEANIAEGKEWVASLRKECGDLRNELNENLSVGRWIEMEVEKVENGGIVLQLNDGCTIVRATPAKAASGTGSKVTSNVFTYKWAKKHPERVVEFYQILVKLHAIDPDTDHEEFEKLFLGEPTDVMVRWLAPKSALYALMKELKGRELIEHAGKIWSITQSHFKDRDDKLFSGLRNQHAPEYLAGVIEKIADTLDPAKETSHVATLDDDTADELWSGIHDRGWEV